MSKALVTGGLGFIGSHLVDKLLADHWEVVVLDSQLTGRKSNLSHHRSNRALKIVEGDIRNRRTVGQASKGCDAVFHFAAHALMRVSQNDPSADIDYNFTGTMNVLDAAVQNSVPDFVFASTSALYGESKVIPTPEDYSGVQTSFYGAAKLAGEAFASALVQFYPLKFWAFRFGTVLGERCRRGAIWDFEHKLMENPRQLEILGNGKQVKDYLYVKDCVDGVILGYEKGADPVNIFNLGLTEKTKVDDVADIVIEVMGLSRVAKKYTGGPRGWKGDNPVVQLSTEKILSLGWRPKVSARDAVRTTAEWTANELGWKRPS
jgi:UDP-glucose 4-epimerase